MISRLRIGSRGSRLAVSQAECVRDMLMAVEPDIHYQMVTISTTGDQNTSVSLEQLGGDGVFVKELEEALLCGEIDIAVHSLKDMLTTIPEKLKLASVPERIDPRDVIISPLGKLADLPSGARIGTGSQRRAVQIQALRPDIEICGLRGNIDTRIRKAFSGEMDGIVMAAAALVRLRMESRISEYLSSEDCIPAVGQGALGIEILLENQEVTEIVKHINHDPSWQAVSAERAFLKSMGGGCRAPIAALGIVENDKIKLEGVVSDPQGNTILRDSISGSASIPEEIGKQLADKMTDLGAKSIIDKFTS